MNELVKDILIVLGSIVATVIAALTFVNSRIDRRFTLVRASIERQGEDSRNEMAGRHAIDRRLQAVETRVAHMPTHEEVRQMREQLAAMGAKLAVVEERSTATAAGVKRIEEFLLSKAHP